MNGKPRAQLDRPGWLPGSVRLYLDHTEAGLSIRALARREGCHASTVLRQVRRTENRRDDPFLDEALDLLGRARPTPPQHREDKDTDPMTAATRPETFAADTARPDTAVPNDAVIQREARRVLRRLSEPSAILAIAPEMDKAAVLRDAPDGTTTRIAVLERRVAQAFALNDWIARKSEGRVSTYAITTAGRAALKRMLDADQRARSGMAEAAAPFAEQHRTWDSREIAEEGGPQRHRVNLSESPIGVLARRRDKEGELFLTPDLVAAAERLREDFELAQMGARVTQNWDRFLTPGIAAASARIAVRPKARAAPVPALPQRSAISARASATWRCAAAAFSKGSRWQSVAWAGPPAPARSCCASP